MLPTSPLCSSSTTTMQSVWFASCACALSASSPSSWLWLHILSILQAIIHLQAPNMMSLSSWTQL